MSHRYLQDALSPFPRPWKASALLAKDPNLSGPRPFLQSLDSGSQDASNRSPRARAGFTLIELMIVVAIVAVLALIAIPTYQSYILKSRRTVAKTSLLDLAAREEKYYSTNNTYTNQPTKLGYISASFPLAVPNTADNYYQLNVTAATTTAFSATAIPQGAQAKDSCATYSINQLSVQGNTGNTTGSSRCWQ